MEKTRRNTLGVIKNNVREGLKEVTEILGIDPLNPDTKEKHTEILLSGWETVKKLFLKKWIPEMKYRDEEEIVTYLKQEKSMHSIYDYVKSEYKKVITQRLGFENHILEQIDPDTFDKINELSFEANIAYNTLLSIMNEQLEIHLALADEDESSIREKAEDYWLNEVYERVMIEYIQYGKDVVDELDAFAKSKGFFDGFDKDMLHSIYNRLFKEKMKEIQMVRDLLK